MLDRQKPDVWLRGANIETGGGREWGENVSVNGILEIHACNNPSPVFKMYTQCRCEHFVFRGGGGVRLDRVGRGLVTKMFPDVQKNFRTYNNFSENTVVFQIHFLMS